MEGNGFKIIKKIGNGSYSKVKLAYSEAHETMVAIKIVSKYNVPAEFLRKFLYNEVTVVRMLRHDNIIKYYQSIESSHRLYVIMQYAENGSILDIIHQEKRLSESRSCEYFRQILSAIEYCHSVGVCHRDIKCENILLDKKNQVKIIDFGFAKCIKSVPKTSGQEKLEALLVDQGTSVSTKVGAIKKEKDPKLSETYCGSYAYASPEILKGVPYDPFMSDVWAMGCVLFAMVFGRLPFDDRDPSKLIKQVQSSLVFPTSVEVTDECKTVMRNILAPIMIRSPITRIKGEPWLMKSNDNKEAATKYKRDSLSKDKKELINKEIKDITTKTTKDRINKDIKDTK
ncbi:unnamed protein product [Diamesa hyperborea]